MEMPAAEPELLAGAWSRSSRVSGRLRAMLAASVALLIWLAGIACSVKRTVRVPVAPGILKARTAAMDELLDLVNRRSDAIRSLSTTSMRVNFTSGRAESGKLQAYRSAAGYLLLKRPDMVRLNVQNPLTKTTILELVSVGDSFLLWSPRDNKFYEGRNSAKEFDLQDGPAFSARPIHIFEAIMPLPLRTDLPGMRVALKEERDAANKYYVLSLYQEADANRLEPIRDVWLERAGLTVARQQFYTRTGSVAATVFYSGWSADGDTAMPSSILIERRDDGYSLDLRFRAWSANPDLPADAFELRPPPGAEHVWLREKAGAN